MIKEIGSEFWAGDTPQTENNVQLPKWINKFGNITLTSCGRGAISLMLEELNLKAKTALLPAYVCNTVILPFIKQGYDCYFYKINTDLTPDLNDILAYKNIGIFLHMAYYGFPTNKSLARVIDNFKGDATIIVEDITHALFSDCGGICKNNYKVASLRKWAGLPSGGFLASETAISSRPYYNETFADIRKKALQLKAHYIKGYNDVQKHQFMDAFAKGEEYLNRFVAACEIDKVSKALISSLDVEQLIERRRTNFKILSDGLGDVEYLEAIFKEIPDSVCPIFYPVYIRKDRNEIQKKLAEQDIYCPVHWHVSEHIKDPEIIENIYGKILSIPCDQRYGDADMQRILDVMRELHIK